MDTSQPSARPARRRGRAGKGGVWVSYVHAPAPAHPAHHRPPAPLLRKRCDCGASPTRSGSPRGPVLEQSGGWGDAHALTHPPPPGSPEARGWATRSVRCRGAGWAGGGGDAGATPAPPGVSGRPPPPPASVSGPARRAHERYPKRSGRSSRTGGGWAAAALAYRACQAARGRDRDAGVASERRESVTRARVPKKTYFGQRRVTLNSHTQMIK